jgi:hypothetical protein
MCKNKWNYIVPKIGFQFNQCLLTKVALGEHSTMRVVSCVRGGLIVYVGLAITRRYLITTKALVITFHTRIWQQKSGINFKCQNDSMTIVIMQLRFSMGRVALMF